MWPLINWLCVCVRLFNHYMIAGIRCNARCVKFEFVECVFVTYWSLCENKNVIILYSRARLIVRRSPKLLCYSIWCYGFDTLFRRNRKRWFTEKIEICSYQSKLRRIAVARDGVLPIDLDERKKTILLLFTSHTFKSNQIGEYRKS